MITVFQVGTLCFSCSQPDRLAPPSYSFLFPKQGNTIIESLENQLVMINAHRGNLHILYPDKTDTIFNCYDKTAPFGVEKLLVFQKEIYELNEFGLTSMTSSRSFDLNENIVLVKYLSLPSVSYLDNIYLQNTHASKNLRIPTNLIAYGRKNAISKVQLPLSSTERKLKTTPVPVPLIPEKWNDGNYYGLKNYLTKYQNIGVISYEKYPDVYLIDLHTGSIKDSLSFTPLSKFGLTPYQGRSIADKQVYLQSQPSYGPVFLINNRLIRVLRNNGKYAVYSIDITTKSMDTDIPFDNKNIGLLQFNDTVYNVIYQEVNSQARLDFIPYNMP